MTTAVLDRGPITALAEEHAALREVERALAAGPDGRPRIVDASGQQIELPESASRLLRSVVSFLARGQAVAIVPLQRELTTQQAADLLNVSRPYLVQLLDEGKIPATKTGTHRRVRFEDVMAFKERRDRERAAALDELARLSEEMGLYDLEAEGKLDWPADPGDAPTR